MFGTLRVATRLTLAFSVIVLLLIAGFVLGISRMSQINDRLEDITDVNNVEISEDGDATITMTLTTPHCPVAESLPNEVELRVLSVPGIRDAVVNLVWDPPWDPLKMSDEARLELGML